MTFGSLFAGIGGFDLGFERAGLECKWQVELDAHCRAVLSETWPRVKQHDDVRTFIRMADEYPLCECCEEPFCETHGEHFAECGCIGISESSDEWSVPDVICGGDPCQENSNSRRAGGLTQASLGGEFIRIVDAVRPRFVLRENPSVVRKDAPWPWWRFRAELERLGYAVLPFRLRACCVGADHRRERLFLLAELQDSNSPRLEGDVGQEMARAGSRRQHAYAPRPAWRSTSPRVCRASDGIPNRKQRLKALGNAVDVGAAEWIGRRLIEAAQ